LRVEFKVLMAEFTQLIQKTLLVIFRMHYHLYPTK
jgi:hypothetical protein